ncbi:MAG: thiamine pyrophosphate-dependent dehydrogenase E1 component subunit alpha [Candidatus Micrarchaeota archaeon]|nr:thiamine pyrophosphate-dependent dehydrogenase E1 component subunit alpha [Candidatus Micrarchaeota archaeon]
MINEMTLLKKMYTIRELEKAVLKLHQEGLIRGTDHFSTGQEAIPIGILSEAKQDDIVTCGHRVHHVAIAKGLEPRRILAEMLGLEEGYNKGKAGIMHLSSIEDNFYGANGIVGASLPISTGIAFALKEEKKKNVVITFLGDGATTQGVFHETLNMASLYSAQILFVCENNLFAQSTPIKQHSAVTDISKKVKEAYGVESVKCDGTDINEVRKVARYALSKVRKGRPFFIEAITYRSCGHSIKDPDMSYMDEKYRKGAQRNDPLEKYERYLINRRLISEEKAEKLKADAENEISQAVAYLLKRVKK